MARTENIEAWGPPASRARARTFVDRDLAPLQTPRARTDARDMLAPFRGSHEWARELAPDSSGEAVPVVTIQSVRPVARRSLAERATTPALVWVAASIVALVLAAAIAPWAAPAAAAAGVLAALVLLRGRPGPMVLTAAAMVPAAFATDAPAWSWVLAGALVALAVSRGGRVVAVHMNDLERHLSWSRRRAERATVLVARLAADQVEDPVALVESFRITDSVSLRRTPRGYDLHAVLDEKDLDRGAVERRIADLTSSPLRCGWATFPDDGVTLDVLLELARQGLNPAHEPATGSRPKLVAVSAGEAEPTDGRR